MELPTHFLLLYGYILLFAWVLFEQLGMPLPATPVLLAAGALSVDGSIRLHWAFLAALAGALLSDVTWFLVGRRLGHHVLRLLCKLSLEPTTCVRRTQDSFSRRRAITLLTAKFVPGLGTLAPPIAAQNGMGFGPFLFFDGIGAAIWVATLLVVGRLFGDAINRNPSLLNWIGRFSGAILILGIIGFFVARLIRRHNVLKSLAAARLEPAALKSQLDAGQPVYIIDLRHPLELVVEPFKLPGAMHFSPESLSVRHQEIPRDRDVILYCTCPSEASAAKTAMALHKLGIERVHPLRGGYDEWKRLGFPLDEVSPASSLASVG
jgi:membrane protein DedA with SNARE-associated domain/rhodanese-related sulfurtransferase